MAERWRDWVKLARPHFLVGGFAFFALGALLAANAGRPLAGLSYVAGQAFVTSTQLGVHFGNEWHDQAADRANTVRTRFAGGSHMLTEGRIGPGLALASSRTAFAAAVAFLALAASLGGVAVGLLGATMLLLSWGYSAPPLQLHSRGIGELATGVIVAGLVPMLAVSLAGAPLDARLALTLLPLVLQVATLVGVLSLPDVAGDAAARKRTLAVRAGPRLAGRLFQAGWIAAAAITLWSAASTPAPELVLASAATGLMAAALPALVHRRRWDTLAVCAAGVVAAQLVATVLSLV